MIGLFNSIYFHILQHNSYLKLEKSTIQSSTTFKVIVWKFLTKIKIVLKFFFANSSLIFEKINFKSGLQFLFLPEQIPEGFSDDRFNKVNCLWCQGYRDLNILIFGLVSRGQGGEVWFICDAKSKCLDQKNLTSTIFYKILLSKSKTIFFQISHIDKPLVWPP